MKTFKAKEGYVFQNVGTGEVYGSELYTPDTFTKSMVKQITIAEAEAILEEQRKQAEIDMNREEEHGEV